MKTHFYPSTGQVRPVEVDLLVSLGVPASTVDALISRGFVPGMNDGGCRD